MKAYEVIKSRRVELGLTQKELGDMVGYTQQAIQKIENGSRSLNEHKINLFAKALGLSILEIFGEENLFMQNHEQDNNILYMKEVIEVLETCLKEEKKEISPYHKAVLIFSLFEEVRDLSEKDKTEKLQSLTSFILKAKIF